jgi:hypothetical protein
VPVTSELPDALLFRIDFYAEAMLVVSRALAVFLEFARI